MLELVPVPRFNNRRRTFGGEDDIISSCRIRPDVPKFFREVIEELDLLQNYVLTSTH